MTRLLDYQSPIRPPVPTALKAAAWVFICLGIFWAVDFVAALLNGNIHVDLGILGIFIGRGLLRLRPGWRTCALVFIWIGLIGLPLLGFVVVASSPSATLRINGLPVGTVPAVVILLPLAVMWLVSFWQYRVLMRPDIRALFGANLP